MRGAILSIALALGGIGVAHAQERIHADLPLFSDENEELWPKFFSSKDSFGCKSRIALGDWRFVRATGPGDASDIQWMRLSNYGVFHCAIIERWADEQRDLDKSGFEYSWLVALGGAEGGAGPVELWALQTGARPGSDYLLLSRRPSEGLIKSFEVLQLECPRKSLREGKGPDIWRTDYCAINTVQELKSLARKMAKRSPTGTLSFVSELPDEND